jgi:hypothetical protein
MQLNNIYEPSQHIENYRPFIFESIREFPFLEGYKHIVISKIYTSVATKHLRAGRRYKSLKYLLKSAKMNPKKFKNYLLIMANLTPIKYENLKNLL